MPAAKPELVDARTQFRNHLIDSAEATFEAILGRDARLVLSYHIPSSLIGDDPRRFHERLCALVKGPAGTLEYLVVKEVYERLGVRFLENGPLDFLKSIQEAKMVAMKAYKVEAGGD